MTEPTTTTPTYDELRALLIELDDVPFTAKALRGPHSGRADFTLRLPNATIKRFWATARALKEQAVPR